MLIVMAGLPGSGKSSVADVLGVELGCAVLSVDPIEAAMWRAGVDRQQPTGIAAYVVAEELARVQLGLGHDVVVDAANDVDAAREQWRLLATSSGAKLVFVEVVCTDAVEHRRRLAARRRNILGFPEPSWESVLERRVGWRVLVNVATPRTVRSVAAR
ncbi:AAA family ATPase [Rhodococcus erythropolis]|uniref:AAA family ATPase n=1 Tax=Rhodococcus erythropolis TaxID=1833 RepID=UPI0029493DD4|nr:AAA family ATPase [Rhodococcus erythropolis]MDV6278140.1 AAA family ATPase [Rhodococcus erythropolis]